MQMILNKCFIFSLFLIASVTASAQKTISEGVQSNKYAEWLSARPTQPKIGTCKNKGANCFRVMIELKPEITGELGISIASGAHDAFTGSGAICSARIVGGIHQNRAWDGLRNKWNLNLVTFADANKPAIAIVDYNCDQSLLSGDEITFQISFDFYASARDFGEARYIFRNITLM